MWGSILLHRQAILRHHLGVLQFNSILTLSTWRLHQIPQVKGSVLQDCPPATTTSAANQEPRSSPVFLTNCPYMDQELQMTPSLDLINLLEKPTETRETFSSLDYQVIIKGYNSKTARWGFPGGAVVENLPANAGDTGSSPGLGRSHMP